MPDPDFIRYRSGKASEHLHQHLRNLQGKEKRQDSDKRPNRRGSRQTVRPAPCQDHREIRPQEPYLRPLRRLWPHGKKALCSGSYPPPRWQEDTPQGPVLRLGTHRLSGKDQEVFRTSVNYFPALAGSDTVDLFVLPVFPCHTGLP